MIAGHSTIDWTDIHTRLRAGEAALEAILHPTETVIREELARRAEQLAGSQQSSLDAAAQQMLPLLVFGIDDRKFAVELADVEEVGSMRQCTPVPGASADLCGIMHHQGEIRSVIDMAHRLGLLSQTPASGGYFLHIQTKHSADGTRTDLLFRVHELHQVLNASPDELVGDTQHEHQALGNVIRAIHPQGIVVLDSVKLCADAASAAQPAAVLAASPDDNTNETSSQHRQENLS